VSQDEDGTYETGRYGTATYSNNPEVALGIRDRQAAEARQAAVEMAWRGDGSRFSYGQGGGLGWVFLAVGIIWLFTILLPFLPDIAYIAFLLTACATVASLLVLAITSLLGRQSTLHFACAWRSSCLALLLYVALTTLMNILVWWFHAGSPTAAETERALTGVWHSIASGRAFAAPEVSLLGTLPLNRWPTLAGMILLVRLPGTLVFARILSQTLARPTFRGMTGFLLAAGVALFTAELSLAMAGGWLGPSLWRHVHLMPLGVDTPLQILVVYSAGLVLPCAFIGGLLGGVIVLWLTRAFATEEAVERSYGQNYSTAVRALLAYGFLTVLALFLFRDADAVVWRVAELVFARGLHAPTVDHPDAVRAAFAALMIFQVPGVLAAGAIVARRESRVYDGVLGYAKGCLVASVTCVAICVPFWTGVLRVLPQIMTSVNGQAETVFEPLPRAISRKP